MWGEKTCQNYRCLKLVLHLRDMMYCALLQFIYKHIIIQNANFSRNDILFFSCFFFCFLQAIHLICDFQKLLPVTQHNNNVKESSITNTINQHYSNLNIATSLKQDKCT